MPDAGSMAYDAGGDGRTLVVRQCAADGRGVAVPVVEGTALS